MSRVSSFHIFHLPPFCKPFWFLFLSKSLFIKLIDCLRKYQSKRGNVNFCYWNLSERGRKKNQQVTKCFITKDQVISRQLAMSVWVCQPLFNFVILFSHFWEMHVSSSSKMLIGFKKRSPKRRVRYPNLCEFHKKTFNVKFNAIQYLIASCNLSRNLFSDITKSVSITSTVKVHSQRSLV